MGSHRRSRLTVMAEVKTRREFREQINWINDMVREINAEPEIPCDYILGPTRDDRCQQSADWLVVMDHSCEEKHAFLCDQHRESLIAAQPLMCYACNHRPVNIVLWEPLRSVGRR